MIKIQIGGKNQRETIKKTKQITIKNTYQIRYKKQMK